MASSTELAESRRERCQYSGSYVTKGSRSISETGVAERKRCMLVLDSSGGRFDSCVSDTALILNMIGLSCVYK